MSEVQVKKETGIKYSLTIQILIATVAGVICGALVGPWISNLKFIGDIWLRLLQMCIVPLIASAVMMAVGNLDARNLGKMGITALKWILTFTVISCLLGYALGILFQPGAGVALVDASQITEVPKASSYQDTLLSFFSTNIVKSMADGAMIPVMIFSLFFGFATNAYTRSTGDKTMVNFIKSLNACVLNIIKIVMTIAPIGIFFLIANAAGAIGFGVIPPMIKFLGAMCVGVLIQYLIYFPLVATICKVNPLKLPKKFAKMTLIAFTTTSSAITLPTMMEDSVTKFGVSRKVADFMGPIGMAMNSTGAAMCYVLAVVFMAQATGIELTTAQIALTVLLSVLLSTGNVGIPGSVPVLYTFLAASMGLPLESVALLIGIDWFTGQFRTILNVDVDTLIAMLISNKVGDLDRDVYNEKKVAEYVL